MGVLKVVNKKICHLFSQLRACGKDLRSNWL